VASGRTGRPSEGGRARIVRSALEAFAEQGYDATAIADIARRAGVAKSVIYHHYGSKAGLYRAVMTAGTKDLVAHVAATRPNSAGDWPWLRAGVTAYFQFIRDHPSVWRLLVRDTPAKPELEEIHEHVQRERNDAMAALITSEPLKDRQLGPKRESFATLLITATKALGDWWLDHRDIPLETIVEILIDFADAAFKRLTSSEGA
jgi:AcrR family transcriptional regulator